MLVVVGVEVVVLLTVVTVELVVEVSVTEEVVSVIDVDVVGARSVPAEQQTHGRELVQSWFMLLSAPELQELK